MQRQETRQLIEVRNLTKVYGGDTEEPVKAIEDVGFEVRDGEFLSIIGPSGCGKSTLLRLVSGLIEPTTGEIRIDGTSIDSPISDIGFMFQSPVLLDWRTVFGNVLLPYEALRSSNNIKDDDEYYRERAHSLIELVNLDDFEDSYPNQLSGGMKQRVAIARTLLPDPSILLMDEPFAALDELTRYDMNKELLDIYRETEKTILFVTHNIQEAVYLSDSVMVLSDRPGRIKDIVQIDIDRPRPLDVRNHEIFLDHVSELRQLLGVIE